MSALRRVGRITAFCLAIVQAGAPGIAALAEATVGAGAGPAAHVEDQTRRTCVPAHPDDCTVCRAISLAGTPGPRTCVGALVGAAGERPEGPPVIGGAASPRRLPPSRAPPAA